ncbi:MAG: threonine synthase [Oscillospiraceae bacterium]|nr:threonine synthase [Oscillospiraceae bacterium]
MKYESTRGDFSKTDAAEAIALGISKDGGLFVPESFPVFMQGDIKRLAKMSYSERAAYTMGLFLDGFDPDELKSFTDAAYDRGRFDSDLAAVICKTGHNTYFLELWHGPTCAFKDMALQVMPHLLTASLNKIGEKREACILVATSGDTGKAALEGFRDVPGTRIMVFYPKDGVSDIQELQMTSQAGKNVNVAAVKGNFDDTQSAVKEIFSDNILSAGLSKRGYFLTSANSINWGRLVPQIAYYVSAYCDLLAKEEIKLGEKINFCVPTGNFGNILAAYYAYMMGLPINKLICASNRNDVLRQFINTGTYDKNRAFYTTVSPSMDILISSNLERLLYELSDKDGDAVRSYMAALTDKGCYDVAPSVLRKIRDIFVSGYCDEEDTLRTIDDTFRNESYLIDTHTAVAYKALKDYRARSGDLTPAVVVSTASPFKFCQSVLTALGQSCRAGGAEQIDMLSKLTGVPAPLPLLALRQARPRFTTAIDKKEMKSAVAEFLGG